MMEDVDLDEGDEWMMHYESDFPTMARCFLSNVFDNWEKLRAFYDELAFAERIVHELRSKADALPINEQNRVIRKEIYSFIRRHNDIMDLYRLCEYHHKLELGKLGEDANSRRFIVKSLHDNVTKADSFRKKLLEDLREISCLQQWHAVILEDNLLERIRTYKSNIIPSLIEQMKGTNDFIQESKSILTNYQFSESKNLPLFFRELRNSWKTLIESITLLESELGFDGKANRKRPKDKQVMFLKHVYLFRSQLIFHRREIWSRCFSLPVAISSHNDQNIEGSSALFWDANYRTPGALGLETRDDVSWSEISNAISTMILTMTDRKPTESNMKFLRALFMGPRGAEETDDDAGKFKQKDLLRPIDDNNTFWDWLMHTVYTLKKDSTIGSLWRQGYFVGYLDQRTVAETIKTALKVLEADPHKNCFILRFSKRNGKDIVLQGHIEGPNSVGIYSVDPYKPEMLRETPLEERIMSRDDCHKLLYEDNMNGWAAIDKSRVFEPFLIQPTFDDLPDGYVPRKVVESTPKWEAETQFEVSFQ